MYKGILYMLLSSLSFSLVNLCVKILTDKNQLFPDIQDYPVHELVLFRSMISLAICIAIIKAKGIPFFGNNKKWLIARGIFGVTSLTLFFFTLKNLPMAVATTVQYLSPVFTVLFAIYFVKEKVRPIQWLFFAISFSGILLIYQVDSSSLDLAWILTGVGSAILSGLAYNSILKCKGTDEPITVVMYFPLIATPVMLIASFIYGFITPQGIEWVLLVIIGILTQIAQISMTKAFNAGDASKITPVKYIGAIYAVLIGFFIFDETVSLYASFGIVLVILGVLLNTVIKGKKHAAM